MPLDRHFSATVYIVRNGKVLLHKHKKFDFWLPVGGHMEPNETPEEAALREALEEAGLEVELVNGDTSGFQKDERARLLVRPAHMLLEKLGPDHEHIDIIFYATARDGAVVSPSADESMEFGWFSSEEIDGLEMPRNVGFLAKEALRVLAEG